MLLDDSFLAALLNRHDEHSPAAHACYADLVAQYEQNLLRLRARHDHLGRHPAAARQSILAPVETVYIAGQHHRQARRLELPFEADYDVAVTMVIMRRERIERIATFNAVFDLLDVTVHP